MQATDPCSKDTSPAPLNPNPSERSSKRAAMSGSMQSREKRKKKRKRVEAVMEAVPKSGDMMTPVVGYFPTGYNPVSPDEPPPAVRVFKHRKYSSRLELVVRPPGANVEFVGTSYTGEAAGAQLCTYSLGVLDKATGTLKIVPIAANKILRLEPRVIKAQALDTESQDGVTEDTRRLADLTSLYGTKKNRGKEKAWRSLKEQINDPKANEDLDLRATNTGIINDVLEDAKGTGVHNIPPHDLSAVVPERAYPLEGIIFKAEWDNLTDILELVQSGADFTYKTSFWQENGYPSFVFNRIPKLRGIEDDEQKKKLACILSYITHLLKFLKQAKGYRRAKIISNSSALKIPRVVEQKLMKLFVDPVSNIIPTEKRELLIGYILVLSLFVDNFCSDPSDIAKDLEMTYPSLKPYYQQLGCKSSHDPHSQRNFATPLVTLPVPLQFPDMKKQRRRKR